MYYLSNQNLVMKNTLIWNLPSGITCPKSTPLCRKSCYAIKSERAFRPNVLPSRLENLECSKNADFVKDMKAVIKAKALRTKNFTGYFRIHESGDFYNQKYLDDWKSICEYFADIKFLAYTKSFHLDFSSKSRNLEIVMSVWKDSEPAPKGFPISFTGIKGRNSIKCQGGEDKCNKCGFKCWDLSTLKKNVWNEIH